jgi:hypothetical protein
MHNLRSWKSVVKLDKIVNGESGCKGGLSWPTLSYNYGTLLDDLESNGEDLR